ncbi:MAG: hypothetical protein EOM46_10370 [Gammaproteobacteria bacterium]|nr:hypothetical protein [Gammaproteobacteria bacterium]
MSVSGLRYLDLKINIDTRRVFIESSFDNYFKQLERVLEQKYVSAAPEEKAKQKRIAQLLLILAIVRIKRYLESLFRLAVSFYILPASWVCKPTKFARITPFIYFP